ncbi:class I SAM-dependent methyltransferase [Sphingomonas sp. BGYR3]|uniref:class I SAM-dependent methyltransferase n=1 Tax=Sphingomonas sp. BGYR3 TaxID=2975483 RepID=UPI0021A976C7|nr:class I SAM-dependent methyltransferase [Sphingomonas sp. BGYR3]MDG5489587.1 class I SAM-dependent methyltransferase [Sphingomonas sp. BGYR3]
MNDHSPADHGRRMDAIYAAQRHIYDLTRKYYLLGRDRMLDALRPPPGGTVLEVGCGTARNLILAARRYPDARCHGFDISAAMLETAQAKVARAGLSARIALAEGDATRFDPAALFALPGFDRIFMSYTLSMIPDWQGAIAEGARRLNPGGELHIVDFGQQERLPAPFRAALFAWLDKFHVTPRADMKAVVERIASEQGMTARFQPLFRGYAWSAVLTSP